MSVVAAIRKLVAQGLSYEQALSAAEIFETDRITNDPTERRRAADRDRKRAKKLSEATIPQNSAESAESAERAESAAPRARVVNTTLPSEEVKNPPETTSQAPKGAKRATRIPDDFVPDLAVAMAEGFTWPEAEREAAKFVDYFRGAPGQRGVKADWPATWRNWCRKASEMRQTPRGPPQLATRRSSIALVHEMARGHRNEQPDQQGNGVSGVDARSAWPGPVASHRPEPQRSPTLDLEPIRDRR